MKITYIELNAGKIFSDEIWRRENVIQIHDLVFNKNKNYNQINEK